MRFLIALLALLCAAKPALADELRPAYLELTEQNGGEWTLVWKASARSRLGATGAAILPDNCEPVSEPQRRIANTNILTTLSLRCDGPLEGKSIGLRALELSTTDALVRIAPVNGEVQTLRLTPGVPIAEIASDEEISNVAWTYTIIGVEHIVFGYDHLLFVLALVLLLKGGWLVVQTVTAFTVAHSITLIGSTLGYMALPSQPVETVIALSIVFLAVEIVKAKPDKARLSERFPWIVAFLFGLLHGFGFAGALAEIGLPEGEVPMALLTFNLGVEIGQLIIVAIAIALLKLLEQYRDRWTQPVKTATAYGIGIVATYWFVERLIA